MSKDFNFDFNAKGSGSSDFNFDFGDKKGSGGGGGKSGDGFNFGGSGSNQSSGFNFDGGSSSSNQIGDLNFEGSNFNFGGSTGSGQGNGFNLGGGDSSNFNFNFDNSGSGSGSGFNFGGDSSGLGYGNTGVDKNTREYFMKVLTIRKHQELLSHILLMISKYQRGNPLCRFNYWFYNKIHPSVAIFEAKRNFHIYKYVIPAQRYNEIKSMVERNNPDEREHVPVLVRSFQQLNGRVKIQRERIIKYEKIVQNVQNKITKIARKHDVEIKRQLDRVRLKHELLTSRLFAVKKRVEIFRQRGKMYALNDGKLKHMLVAMQQEIHKPNAFKDKIIRLVPKVKYQTSEYMLEKRREQPGLRGLDEKKMKELEKFLKLQMEGIQNLTTILTKEMKDVRTMNNIIIKDFSQ